MTRRDMGLLALAATALGVLSGHNGGCHPDEGAPLPSPVNAVAVVIEAPDGSAEARLSVWTRALQPAAWLDGESVALPALSTDEADLPLEPTAPGTWSAPVAYLSGELYRFSFDVDAAAAERFHVLEGTFTLAVDGAPAVLDATVAPLEDGGAEVRWFPESMRAFVRVIDGDGECTHEGFDPERLDFESSDWGGIARGGATLPAEALSGPGPHQVWVCGADVVRRDALPSVTAQHDGDDHGLGGGLGWLSGAVAARCIAREVPPSE